MKTIPGIFLSHDGYLNAGIFCLRQYAKAWPDCPIRFIVPANSEESAQRFRDEAPAGLDMEVVLSETPLKATLMTLDQAAGDSDWVFWCSSDRYPTLAAVDTLNSITADLAERGDAAADAKYQGIRFVHWKDSATVDRSVPPVVIGGEEFYGAPMSKIGFWQPQFLRRSWLREMIAGLADDSDLNGIQAQVTKMITDIPQGPLVCERPLIKVEEPIRKGRATMNYALRQLRLGGSLDGLPMEAVTVAYSSVGNRQANKFWELRAIEPGPVLEFVPDASPFHVVSPGGVGSKHLVSWLYPTGNLAARSRAHSHRRLPPVRLRDGERAVYVFGDPRNIIVSIFGRRVVRHERHGFKDVNPVRDNPEPDFGMRHGKNLQVMPHPMTPEWDLPEYLKQQHDAFRFEEHFDFWLGANADYEVTFVRYETLWQRSGELAAHLGIERTQPQFQQRSSDWRSLDDEARTLIDQLHGKFARRLEALPDLFAVKNGVPQTLDGVPLRFASV